MKVLKHDIEFMHSWYKRGTIPAGTPVKSADNMPDGGYWVEATETMSAEERSWVAVYGVHVTEDDVEEKSQ